MKRSSDIRLSWLRTWRLYWRDLFSLLFPDRCQGCDAHLVQGERVICTTCEYELPRTNYHREMDNIIEKIFWGRVEIDKAAAFLTFEKLTKVQQLMHQLKYNGRYDVGVMLGEWYGRDLAQSGWSADMDLIIPVPLNKKKRRKRGYNQAMAFAEGLSNSTGLPASDDIMIRTRHNPSQTKLNRLERWENVQQLFSVQQPGVLQGKHVLLVDDVVTTGATLESCATALLNAGAKQVSLATIAYAKL